MLKPAYRYSRQQIHLVSQNIWTSKFQRILLKCVYCLKKLDHISACLLQGICLPYGTDLCSEDTLLCIFIFRVPSTFGCSSKLRMKSFSQHMYQAMMNSNLAINEMFCFFLLLLSLPPTSSSSHFFQSQSKAKHFTIHSLTLSFSLYNLFLFSYLVVPNN